MPVTMPFNQSIKASALALCALFALPALAATAASAEDPGCRACLQSASGFFARGDNEGAAKLLTQWQAKCPNNLQLCLMLNTVLMRMPDGKKRALAAADQACTIAPTSMLAHFQKAMTLMQLQEGPAAAQEFQRVVQLDPTSYESWLALSELLGAQGKSAAAKDAESHAAQLSPSARRSTLTSLASKNRAGNIQGLKQEVMTIVDDPNTAPETLLIVGEEVFKLGYFEEAAAALGQARSKYPEAPQVKTLLPCALFECGKISDSFKSNAGDKGTTGGTIQQAISGMDALASGDYDAGKNLIEKASSAGENQGIIYLAQGCLAMHDGRYKEAIESFSDALKKDANLTVAKVYIAQNNLALGDWKEAISQARESQQKASGLKVRADAIELVARLRDGEDNGTNIAALKSELIAFAPRLSVKDQSISDTALGELAIKNKTSGRAKEYFNSALAHMAASVSAVVGLAQVALLEGDAKSALDQANHALALAPGNIDGLSFKAVAQLENGDMAGAAAALAKAVAEGELPPATYLLLGQTYQKAGQKKEAEHYLKQAMQAGLSSTDLEQAKASLTGLGAKAPGK
jgi:tetratricopeptide (TPR) repeat protein